jgi:hypothetical protein
MWFWPLIGSTTCERTSVKIGIGSLGIKHIKNLLSHEFLVMGKNGDRSMMKSPIAEQICMATREG